MITVLKDLKVVAANLASDYIQALAGETMYTIVGKKIISWQGKKLIIVKALYVLKSSGAMWHHKFSDNLRDLGFHPCH